MHVTAQWCGRTVKMAIKIDVNFKQIPAKSQKANMNFNLIRKCKCKCKCKKHYKYIKSRKTM